jgi:2-methylcitrate dehydratase PrpD
MVDMAGGLSRKLAAFATDFRAGAAPKSALANAKLAILDCLGVAVLAVTQEAGKSLLRMAEQEGWHGPCTIWGSERCASSRDAAFANGTLAHALDYDDGGHASTYLLAAAMAVAERSDASGTSLLEAFVVGREIRMALEPVFADRFEGAGPGARGWHANGIFGPIGAACAAAKIIGLDFDHTLNAVGLAAGSCGALGRDGGVLAKPFRAGQAASTGVTCALLAAEGFTGDEEALEGPYGLLSAIGPVSEKILATLGQGLGREYDLSSHGVKVKNIAAGARAHAPVEAMLRLLGKEPVAFEDVESIDCDVHPYPLLRLAPRRGHEGRFSMAYCLAVALLLRRLDATDFTDDLVQDPRIQKLIRSVRHTPGSKTLTLNLKSGKILRESIEAASDMRDWDSVAEKFTRCVRDSLTERQRASVLEQVSHLEEVSSVRTIAASLRGRAHEGSLKAVVSGKRVLQV